MKARKLGTALVLAGATAGLAASNVGAGFPDLPENPKLGDLVLFGAQDPAHGYEVWRSDGTKKGTKRVADINKNSAGADSSFPSLFTRVGKLALFRHFERDAQPDIWNYTAYIMAMGKGYLPWSEKLAFRYGVGFGVSYAEAVPSVEVIKQGERDRNTSRLLNYLEFQADFPIDRIVKWQPLHDCYAGVTVVHRSGIFGTADILGEVFGGSDWVTLHLECMRGGAR